MVVDNLNGREGCLGNALDAEPSVPQPVARKSEKAAPFNPYKIKILLDEIHDQKQVLEHKQWLLDQAVRAFHMEQKV